jgi:UDP-N-acetylglucosamine--N-acetylmuramyl-(pentapeptide) pyrophosphoryl-undecaprenol N-acetylglucosamine transferase
MPEINRVIISGGGTGGHIFPAIAIANTIKRRNSNAEILFVGANDRMEMQKVPESGYKIIGLWISGLQRKVSVKNILFPIKLILSVVRSFFICIQEKPDVVVGVGGYASGPLLFAASLLGVSTLIQEQNSYAGITNKLLAARVSKICVAFEKMERFFPKNKIIFTGNPIRKDIQDISSLRPEALSHFGLSNKRTILILGGSLGARSINEAIAGILDFFVENNLQLIWQTGKNYIENAEQKLSDDKFRDIKSMAFIKRMDLAYAASDYVVSRAGALSISELCVVKKACVLIPSPNVSEDHQTKNAMALVDNGAALFIKDSEIRAKLEDTLSGLISSAEIKNQLESNIAKMGICDADERIVDEIQNLL